MNYRIKKTVTWLFCLSFLIGVTYSGYSVLCISTDGHSEFETLSFPCCTAIEDSSELNTSDSKHNEQSECFNCLDVEVGNLQQGQRFQRDDFDNLIKFTSASAIDAIYCSSTIGLNNSPLTKFHQLYNQRPPSHSLITTILRC